MHRYRRLAIGVPEWVFVSGMLLIQGGIWLCMRDYWSAGEPGTLQEKLNQLFIPVPDALICYGSFLALGFICVFGLTQTICALRAMRSRARHLPLALAGAVLATGLLSCTFFGGHYAWLLSDTHTYVVRHDGNHYTASYRDDGSVHGGDLSEMSISGERYAQLTARLPELATRWGFTPPAEPQKPVYLSSCYWLYRLWQGLVVLQLLQLLRYPLYLRWRGRQRLRRQPLPATVVPSRPLDAASVDF